METLANTNPRFDKMSHNEGNDNSQQNGKTSESGKKKVTLADATHILKAEAIRRLDLGDTDFETEGGEVEKEQNEAARLRGKGEVDTKEEGSAERIVLDKSTSDTERSGEAVSIANRDSFVNESASQSRDQLHEVMNNSGKRASGLGDDAIMEKGDKSESKETGQLSPNKANKEPDFTTDLDRDTITKPNGMQASYVDKNSADKADIETRNKTDTAANDLDSHIPAQDQTSNLLEEQETLPMSEERKGNFDSSDLVTEKESADIPASNMDEDKENLESAINGRKEQMSSPKSLDMSKLSSDTQQTNDHDIDEDRHTTNGTGSNALQKDNPDGNLVVETKSEDGTNIGHGTGDNMNVEGATGSFTASDEIEDDSAKRLNEVSSHVHEGTAPQELNGVTKVDSEMSRQQDETVSEEDKMSVGDEDTLAKTSDARNEEGVGKLLSRGDAPESAKEVDEGTLIGSRDDNLESNEATHEEKESHKDVIDETTQESKDVIKEKGMLIIFTVSQIDSLVGYF